MTRRSIREPGTTSDTAIIKTVVVNGGSLTFDALWNEELGWDFGFVQISTDDGVTYSSIPCTDTTTTTDPDALPTAKNNVPGFTGYSAAWKSETCSLAGYSGTCSWRSGTGKISGDWALSASIEARWLQGRHCQDGARR